MQGRSHAWAWGGGLRPPNKNIAPKTKWSPLALLGLGLCFLLDIASNKLMGLKLRVISRYLEYCYLINNQRFNFNIIHEFTFRFDFFCLICSRNYPPLQQKSWLRTCPYVCDTVIIKTHPAASFTDWQAFFGVTDISQICQLWHNYMWHLTYLKKYLPYFSHKNPDLFLQSSVP